MCVVAVSDGRFAEAGGGNAAPPLMCDTVSGGRLEGGSRKEATSGADISTGAPDTGVISRDDLAIASVCAPVEIRDRELERD